MYTLCTHFLFFLYPFRWGCGNQEKPHKPGFSNKTNSSNVQGIFTICTKTLVVKIWFFSSCKRAKKTLTNSHQIHRKQLSQSQTCWTCPKCGDMLSTYQVYDLHKTEVELHQEGMGVVDHGSVRPVVAMQQISEQPALVGPLNRICT